MNSHDERKYLASLLKQLDTPHRNFLSTYLPTVVAWVLVALFVMFLAEISQGYRANPIALALGSLFVGFIVAWVSCSEASIKQWPMLRGHINRQSVESRIGELEA